MQKSRKQIKEYESTKEYSDIVKSVLLMVQIQVSCFNNVMFWCHSALALPHGNRYCEVLLRCPLKEGMISPDSGSAVRRYVSASCPFGRLLWLRPKS